MVHTMNISFTATPSTQDKAFLTRQISAETPTYGDAHSFGFFMRDAQGEILAGCHGYTFYGFIFTEELWVHPDHRKQGLGRQLMDKAHDFGRAQGCKIAFLSTMSFQKAEAFYQRLGYERAHTLTGGILESSLFCMRRDL
jgi:GNAT superfamily N-acetyltransferase